MKNLLIATALIECGAGVALICFPSWTAALLVGSPLDTPTALTVGHLAGTALLALGIACWVASTDASSRAAKGLVGAMVLYNLGAVVFLGSAGVRSQKVGVLLWPAVVLHGAMTVWCLIHLRRKPTYIGEGDG